MSEELNEIQSESGVEVQDDAGLQTETEEKTENQTATETSEPGVEEPAAAEQEETQEEEQEEGASEEGTSDKLEKAFAKKWADKEQKLRQEIKQATEQELFQRYGPIFQLAYQEAQKYGMDPVQWAQAIMQTQEQQYYKQLEEQGIDPRLIENHPALLRIKQKEQELQLKEKQLAEKERVTQEINEFIEVFPDVKKIPPEVWELREKRGLSILDAYLRVNYKKLAEQAKAEGEQAAIAAIRQRKEASTGPAKGGATPQKSAWDIPKEDFERMVERVKRGEKITF